MVSIENVILRLVAYQTMKTNNKKSVCCERCDGLNLQNGPFCVDEDCWCHKPTPTEAPKSCGWSERTETGMSGCLMKSPCPNHEEPTQYQKASEFADKAARQAWECPFRPEQKPTEGWIGELKRQCEIRGLPFEDVKYLCTESFNAGRADEAVRCKEHCEEAHAKGYEEGLRETAIKLDKNMAEWLKGTDEASREVLDAVRSKEREETLQWVLKSSGGGDWRRRIEQALSEFKKGER